MDDTVKAIWVGPFVAELEDRTQLVPGETVVELPRLEAEASDNWKVTEAKRARPEATSPALAPVAGSPGTKETA